MNPTANKSDFEDLTTHLRDLAYSYLEKYSPSKQQLKVHLLKKYLTKIKGTKSKKEVTAIIDEIIIGLEKNKILDDELYSDSKARMFLRRGYSLNKINQSLRNKGIDNKFIKSIISFIYMYLVIFFILTALLSLTGLDFVTSISGAATSISNVGPGLGSTIGPNGNFSSLPDISKWILTLGMILGRLELFAILVLFLPSFWRN